MSVGCERDSLLVSLLVSAGSVATFGLHWLTDT